MVSMLTRPTPKQFLSIPCPTCGVAAGQRCERYSGRPRKEPHIDRKLAVFEAVVGVENSGAIQFKVETYFLSCRAIQA